MLRFSSQTIHDIMFPGDRLRQTFFFFFFLLGIRVQNMAISFFQAPIIQKMDSAIHRIKSYPVDNIRWLAIYPVDSAIHHLNNVNCKGADVPFDSKLKREKSLKKKTECKASSQANFFPWLMKRAFIFWMFFLSVR